MFAAAAQNNNSALDDDETALKSGKWYECICENSILLSLFFFYIVPSVAGVGVKSSKSKAHVVHC